MGGLLLALLLFCPLLCALFPRGLLLRRSLCKLRLPILLAILDPFLSDQLPTLLLLCPLLFALFPRGLFRRRSLCKLRLPILLA